jgi:hypothetical protein
MQWSSRPELARHYREAGQRGYCVQCRRRAINSIVKTIERFASWTWHTKSSLKFYKTVFYPTLTQPFSIARLGSNKVNQQQTNSIRQHNKKWSLRWYVRAQLPYKINTPYQSNAHNCDVLLQITLQLFWILWNPTRIQTGRRIIYAAFQCRVGSYWRANLLKNCTIYNKETQLLAYVDDIDIIGRSQSAVRDAYLALEREAAKVGLRIN